MEKDEKNTAANDNLFKHTEEGRYYRNFLSWWKLRFPSDENEKVQERTGSESLDAKVFDHKSKKFVISKEDKC